MALTLAGTLILGAPLLAGFLLIPLVPILFGRRSRPSESSDAGTRSCPACGWKPQGEEERFCPRDGSPLQ